MGKTPIKCPHCLISFHAELYSDYIKKGQTVWTDNDGTWMIRSTLCPACKRSTFFLLLYGPGSNLLKELQVWPKGVSRSPLPPEVPDQFADDYREACLVLSDSTKASSALSRRCLQLLLREKAGVKATDLSKEIDEVLASKMLPSDLADAIDAVRHVGNFAAHPLKSTNTGLILDVEPGEAEWTLDVLEDLFDFYFVRPARTAAKRDTLNKKLAEAGKPPMKKGSP